jgi:hypothetical protein
VAQELEDAQLRRLIASQTKRQSSAGIIEVKRQKQPARQVSDILIPETIEAVHRHIVCEYTLEDREWNQIRKRAIKRAHERVRL